MAARLEVELAGVGFEKFRKQTGEATKEAQSLYKSLDKASDGFAKANATSLGLEKELKSLNDQLKAGAISADLYAKEQSEISTALSSSRQAAQTYQAQISSINATLKSGEKFTSAYGDQVNRLSGVHASYSKNVRGSYGVTTEFARIIQDAPYGIQGVGNNIQQLTSNYQIYAKNLRDAAAEQGKSISSFSILKSAASGLLSPLSLITIGVSLATTAWTAYTMWSQKSAKADEEKAKSAKKVVDANELYLNSLGAIDKLRVKGEQNAQKEIVSLGLLYSATRNVNLPMTERFKAAKALQDQYPDTFKNFTQEQIALGKASSAYKELSKDILATARVAAATDIITENTRKLVLEQLKFNKATKELEKINKSIADTPAIETRAAGSAGIGASTAVDPRVKALNDLTAQQNKLQKDLIESQKIKTALVRENLSVEKLVTQEVKNQGVEVLATSGKGNGSKKVKTPVDRSGAIVARSDASADLSGLTGVDRDVETVRQKYIKLYSDLSINAKKSADGRRKYETDLLRIQANEADEIGTIVISEQQRVANEIQRILNDSGVAASENRAKELAAIQKWYDAEILKARDSAEIIASINQGRAARIDAVDSKYEAKRLDAQNKLVEKINSISEKQFTLNENFSNRTTSRNKEALKERLKDIEEHFAQLKKLYANNPLALTALGIAQTVANQQATENFNAAENGAAKKVLSDLVVGFGNNFYRTLTSINQQADRSFTAIVGSLGEQVTGMIQDTFSTQLGNILKEFVNTGKISFKDLGVGLAGIAGGLISGATNRTSSAGQAVGGALTGAAAGFAVGGPIGAALGGVLGAVSGLLGASKARKEERELQKKQLEEAQKQTEILRQNATNYTSSIIGRMTDQGVLTNVEVGAFGQLKAVVNGKQIDFILDRTNNSR
jgi:hypothetical protein